MHNHAHQLDEDKVYTCPMHPEVKQDQPGMCPECGMALVPSPSRDRPKTEFSSLFCHSRAGGNPVFRLFFKFLDSRFHGNDSFRTVLDEGRGGHDKHEGHSLATFARKFWVSLILTIPVVLYSELPQRLFGWQALIFPGSQYIALLLGSIVFFYGGWVFLLGAWRELRAKMPGMMTLIGVAITAAYLFSVFEVLRGSPHNLFWELATLVTIMLLGHYLEMRAVQGAQSALKELSKLLPDTAEVIIPPRLSSPTSGEEMKEGGRTKIIPISELKVGDLVLVKPGSKVPADGVVSEGSSDVDESIMTGESKPVSKKVGSEVIAGTINGDGSLQVQVTKIGEKTFLAGVMRLVAQAQASKSRLQILSDRAAFYLTIIALATGAVTFVTWLVADKGVITATERLVAVLVIACPHALGLAVPLVASISTTMAARKGFLVKQRLALEAARNIDVVLFDKTGTLTLGEFGVEKIILNNAPFPPLFPPHLSSPIRLRRREELKEGGRGGEGELLQLAASVNQHSEHPIARAIVKEAEKRKLGLLEVRDFQRLPGKGAKAKIAGQEVVVGSEAVLPPSLSSPTSGEELKEGGQTVIYVIKDKQLMGAIALADLIREESREAVKSLQKMGLKTAMITGDSEDVAAWVAGELGIDEYFARVLPEQKANIVRQLQEGIPSKSPLKIRGEGRGVMKVAFVGDGVNDAPALSQADLGIAIGAGTNVAIESAGIILVKNDPRDIPKIIKLSHITYKKMLQNLFWATGYNVVALPLAAGVLAQKGILLEPALAAVFMSLSTVIVAINALFLRRKTL